MARRLVASLLPLLTWGLGPRGAPALSRSQLIRGAGVGAYGALLVGILNAENSPDYQNAVRRTIARAVPRGGLRVLEVGIGTAPNLGAYPRGTALVGLDARLQDDDSRAFDEFRAARRGVRLTWVEGDAARMPFDDGAFDAVVAVKALCSVADPGAVVREVSRVLAPGGRFGFVEHVAADEGTVLERTQLLLDPLQQLVAGNCHLHRDTDRMIARSVGDAAHDPAVADSAALFSRAEAAERYVVWPMWPIAQRAAGVVVK